MISTPNRWVFVEVARSITGELCIKISEFNVSALFLGF
jgi:hypothetical protein